MATDSRTEPESCVGHMTPQDDIGSEFLHLMDANTTCMLTVRMDMAVCSFVYVYSGRNGNWAEPSKRRCRRQFAETAITGGCSVKKEMPKNVALLDRESRGVESSTFHLLLSLHGAQALARIALLRLQQHCSLLQVSTSHLPTLLRPPRNPRRSQPSPPNAARTPSPSITPPPAEPILARNAAAAPWRGELLLLLPAAWPLPALAAEADGGGGSKVSLESIVLAVDDFNNRNPFFVAGVVFVWLVVLPLAQEYFKKYKAVGALDAFRKLRDVPEAQLLDVRRGSSVRFMAPPNLRLVEKSAVQVEFDEEDEKRFLGEVLARFPDPAIPVCVCGNRNQ
ncbi:rhodanese-like domain-containing protein 4A, chloroplastic [Triticum dicoccoides]|uniref:rhodanese-like domain-containing protein 4A, chloroplastic n=1 Tax=Triticum dicoccoides TaxID=85692 RepID=UPI00188E50A9|nr:rhodanese-like domain-containing protein 4A, chloroplastic [Triticum dicoccoides]